jgi:hypothetical protein
MWNSIPSFDAIVQLMAAVFTTPSFHTHCELLLAWVMCPGKRTEYKVFETAQADTPVDRSERHPFDRYYNFFSRSAWSECELSRAAASAVVEALCPCGPLYVIIDDTLLHKRGENVYGLGWFYDAVASTETRTVTAPGNNWVVVSLSIPIPGIEGRFVCLPLLARLHLAGKEHPSCQDHAAEMIREIRGWFPDRQIISVGDGGYSANQTVAGRAAGVTHVGLMRADAELYSTEIPERPPSTPGPKPRKGARLPNPRKIAELADANEDGSGPWTWIDVTVTVSGTQRTLKVVTGVVLWPKVGGLVPVRIVIVRDPERPHKDYYLFTTDIQATPAWVIATYLRRPCIEQTFRASKQYLQIQAPHHWCRQSIEKLAPWVWLLQTHVILWYLVAGRFLPEAEARRQRMGRWDSEWSLRHMLQTLRDAILNQTITTMSAENGNIENSLQLLKYCLQLAM